MSIILTMYLAGMPFTLALLLWALSGAPKDELIEVGTVTGIIAVGLFVLLWPLFIFLSIYDVMTER
jgi:type IV secretory pathway TrbL component